jgi:hypothetical protein
MNRNRRYLTALWGPQLEIADEIPEPLASLLFEAETSGGLLFSVAASRAHDVVTGFERQREACWEIGEVLADPVVRITA